jgi:hypothetical protein
LITPAFDTGDAGGEDDRAAVAGIPQRLAGMLHHQQRADQVDAQQFRHHRRIGVEHPLHPARHAGVGKGDVDPPEVRLRAGDHRRDIGLAAGIHRHRNRSLAERGSDIVHRFRAVAEHNPRALCHETLRRRPANAAGGTSDNRDFSVE